MKISLIQVGTQTARELRRVRAEALPKLKGGLRALYRTLELPGANPLKAAHAALDTAVLTAYGFSAKKDLLAQLLALNQQAAANIEIGSPITAPACRRIIPTRKNWRRRIIFGRDPRHEAFLPHKFDRAGPVAGNCARSCC